MPARIADAEWRGNLMEGTGRVHLGSGTFEGPYHFKSRFGDGGGTNPEELIAAAHAGCFSMAFANILAGAGHTAESVRTTAKVHLGKVGESFAITKIELSTEGRVPASTQPHSRRTPRRPRRAAPCRRPLRPWRSP